MARADRPRLAALDVLASVREDDAYTNLALPIAIERHRLDARDAALTTELVSGTIRRRATYDAVLATCSNRPLGKADPVVLDALRLGTHQLLNMRVPPHAAINTSVDLVRARGKTSATGFVNAVLRKVAAQDLATWLAEVAPDAATRHSHPEWVVEELRRAAGDADLEALLEADNAPPKVTLVARPGRAERAELPGEPTPYSPYGVVLDGGNPAAVPAVAEGRAGVQDEGSQLVALVTATAPIEGPDRAWLDLCAGPGGKSALLAGLAAERGAGLVAVERQHHRSRLVSRALAGAEGVIGVLTADGTAPPLRPAYFDRVLVDAPCTGLGALRRRPEARWRRRPEDLETLVPLQRLLLSAALELVRPGGLVVYATCSPVLAETADVVTATLKARPDVELADAQQLLPEVPDCAGPLPLTLQLWPHRHGTDAMFVAVLRRQSRLRRTLRPRIDTEETPIAILYPATLRPSKREILADWLPRQSWYPADQPDFSLVGQYRFDDPEGEVGIESFIVRRAAGGVFHVPLTYRGAPADGPTLVSTMSHSVLGARWVYDATTDPVYRAVLAEAIATGGHDARQQIHHEDGTISEAPSTTHAWGVPGQRARAEPVVVHALDPAESARPGVLLATWDGQEVPVVVASHSSRHG